MMLRIWTSSKRVARTWRSRRISIEKTKLRFTRFDFAHPESVSASLSCFRPQQLSKPRDIVDPRYRLRRYVLERAKSHAGQRDRADLADFARDRRERLVQLRIPASLPITRDPARSGPMGTSEGARYSSAHLAPRLLVEESRSRRSGRVCYVQSRS